MTYYFGQLKIINGISAFAMTITLCRSHIVPYLSGDFTWSFSTVVVSMLLLEFEERFIISMIKLSAGELMRRD